MEVVDFTLPNQKGINQKLPDYKGKWIILYFYPKDDTPGCTTEACNFRDSIYELENLGVIIFGISADGVKSHKKFAEKFNLNFSILSDENLDVIKKYNAWEGKDILGQNLGFVKRITYLINPQFKIEKIYENVNPTVHAKELILYLQSKK